MAAAPHPASNGASSARRRGRHDPLQRLNDHHRDDLLLVARTAGGQPEATAARAERITVDGIDLTVDTPNGEVAVRVAFAKPVTGETPASTRTAFRTLARQARAAATDNQPSGS